MIELDLKIKVGQEVGDLILRIERPFQCCVTPNVYKSCENNLQVPNYYKPPSYHGLHIYLLKQSKVDVSKQNFKF